MDQDPSVREVQVDQKFSIDLEALPGAGYMWELASPPDSIELTGQEVVSASREIGGSSTQRFTLVAHQPGHFTLGFVLKRRWEKAPARKVEYSIRAR